MSALPWIAAALAGGGLYLWWKSRQQPSGGGGLCAQACAAASSQGIPDAACLAACNGLGNFFGSFGGGSRFTAERDRRQAVNDQLNGAPDVANPMGLWGTVNGASDLYGDNHPGAVPAIIQSKVLRYKNGCVPLYDAPGFQRCAAGTLDMYRTAIGAVSQDLNFGGEEALQAPPAFETVEAKQAWVDAHGGDDINFVAWRHIDKTHAMTGQSGDPTTQGPWYGTDGKPFWYVRGKRVSCVKADSITGHPLAPRAIVLQAHDDSAAASDVDAASCVDIFADPTVVSQGGGCANGMPTIPGTTWDPVTKSWRRQTVLEVLAGTRINPGPCAPLVVNVSTTIDVSDALSHGLRF